MIRQDIPAHTATNKQITSRRRALLTSKIALMFAGVCLPYYFIFDYFGIFLAKIIVIPTFLIYIASYLLIKVHFDRLAKFLIVAGTSVSLCFYALFLGQEAGPHLILFALVSMPLMLFETENERWLISAIMIPIMCSLALETVGFKYYTYPNSLSPQIVSIFHYFSVVTTFVLTLVSVFSYFLSNQSYEVELESKNETLKDTLLELEVAIQEIKDKQGIEQEIAAARQIQMGILPASPPLIKSALIEQWFIPAKQVGGDYFDYLVFSESRVGIILADIVGKGIPASLMMIALRGLIVSTISKSDTPAQALEKLNPLIYHHNTIQKYVPMVYGILDTKAMTFTYTNAGHEPGLLFHNDEVTELLIGGSFVGMYEREEFESETIHLSPEDRIVLFTDGLTDIKHENGERIGFDGIQKIFATHKKKKGNHFVENVSNELLNTYHTNQTDDMTLVTIKI